MSRKNLIIIVALVLVAGVAAVSAGEKPLTPGYNSQAPQLVYNVNETLNHLKRHIDLWHDANLKGDADKISLYEGVLKDIINDDIAQSKKTVRSLAQLAVLESMSENSEENSSDEFKNPIRTNDRFKNMVSNLNAKKKLADAFNRARAFSNKYRLLGDYVYLLQQELKIVRVEIASEESDESESEK